MCYIYRYQSISNYLNITHTRFLQGFKILLKDNDVNSYIKLQNVN